MTYTPDTPFRNGVTGKYKLLIRSVTPAYNGYEYTLVDADGKEYKAVSPKHFAQDDVLRCMVHFSISNASLIVTETLVCSKQDLAIPIPESPKPKPKPKPEAKVKSSASKVQPISDPMQKHLGDPYFKKVSGMYVFKVAGVQQENDVYSYRVEDAKRRQYEVCSNLSYPIGCIVDCKVQVTSAPSGALRVSVSSIRKHLSKPKQSTHKHKRGSALNRWHPNSSKSSSTWPSPCSGDRFHIIYTPMGNKR